MNKFFYLYFSKIPVKLVLTLLITLLLYAQLPFTTTNVLDAQCYDAAQLDDFDADDIHVNSLLNVVINSFNIENHVYHDYKFCTRFVIPQQRAPPVFS